MESANHRMHFGNPRGCLGLLDGIDDAAVAACGKNDKSASLEVVSCGEFMLELVGDDRLGLLFLWQLVRIAADPMRNAYFMVLGESTFSKLRNPICPVVKAWSATNDGPSA